MTTRKSFQSGSQMIRDNITKWVQHITVERGIHVPLEFTKPSLAFRNGFDDDSSSDGTMQSYISACSSIFTVQSEVFNDPPQSTTVPVQAWASPDGIPNSLTTHTIMTPNSSITDVELIKKQEEIDHLQSQVATLTQQVKMLVDNQNRVDPICQSSPSQGVEISADSIAKVAQMVLQQMRQTNDTLNEIDTVDLTDFPSDLNMDIDSIILPQDPI